jgi:NAD(P)-dependent dehydrogenase (short-subunit alcohol dehydrogenase family)
MDKVVLITGAGKGLGRALANLFLSHSWRVIATDVDELSMAGLLVNPKAMIIKMDVTSDLSVNDAFTLVHKENITIDLVINNAGIDRYFPLSETPVDRFREVFEVNVFGGYRVNQVFLPLMKQPGGRIIHISSESLHLTVPFMPYPMSKQLVESYAKALRMELKFFGIDVVVIRPGAIQTQLLNVVSALSPASGIWKLEKPFKKFAAMASREIGTTISPEKAASFIFKISGTRYPSMVYTINNMMQLRLAALLPYGIWEKMILMRLGIKPPAGF